MRIGLEFVSSMEIIDGIAAYTGGTNYAKTVLKALEEDRKHDNINIILFLPEGFQLADEDKMVFNRNRCEIRYAISLTECDCSDLDIMFFPQVNGTTLHVIPKIKKKFPSIKICATLHDRQHNFIRYDWEDRFYFSGLKRTGIPGFVVYYLKRLIFTCEYGRKVKYIDNVFTVSNYSMQKLVHKKVRNIKYFIQGNIVESYLTTSTERGNFILLVSGERPEKNLLRVIEAYCRFKRLSNSNVLLKVTGVGESTKRNLLQKLDVMENQIRNTVEFLPYLTYQQLSELYANCRYVVFMSKGEGYGLPVREAMNYGKTVLASRITSVPEVAGAAIMYVDPFSVESICDGFLKLDNDKTLSRYENYIIERNKIIKKLANQDMEILIDELLE